MNNFYFDSPNDINALGGPAAKFRSNVTALQLLKRLEVEERSATSDEQRTLARYTGWGDAAVLKQAFARDHNDSDADESAHPLSPDMAALNLSDAELRSLRASSLNAHYTALPIVNAIWAALLHLGLDQLPQVRVLDPSAGVGHFISLLPQEMRDHCACTEVELDTLTARILAYLHPQSKVLACGFEAAPLPRNGFELVLSNVPFGDYPIVDAGLKERYLKASIHDYFFAKAVEQARSGGIIAFVTSRFSLDKHDPRVRRWLAQHVELLAAVRLPESAFRKNAGTEVVTDILMLQKKPDNGSPHLETSPTTAQTPGWIETREYATTKRGETLRLNGFFLDHPEYILGELDIEKHGMYSGEQITVRDDGRDLAEAIRSTLIAQIGERRITDDRRPSSDDRRPRLESSSGVAACKPSHRGSSAESSTWPDAASLSAENCERLAGLRRIYDAAKLLLRLQLGDSEDAVLDDARQALNRTYDEFVWRFSFLNHARNTKLLGDCPALPFLKALETDVDIRWGTARKATLFSKGGVRAAQAIPATPSAKEALLIELDRFGAVNLDAICQLTGSTHDDALAQLRGLIFRLPSSATGVNKDQVWVTADAYLSGNIRDKLREAQAQALIDPAFNENVAALEAALPAPLKAGEITARLGAGWIPPEVVMGFVKVLLPQIEGTASYFESLGQWVLEISNTWVARSVEATQQWGTRRKNALELIEDGLNARQPMVYDTVEDEFGKERRVLNQTETIAAQAKLAEIKAKFEGWVWEDANRALQLAAIYNERFNAVRARRFDGSHLSLPGLSRELELRSHQKDAIWRMLQSKTTLLGHVVGAGKTLSMIGAAMEMRRLGLTRKCLAVVPNHLTEQWLRETLRAYPNAEVLCAGQNSLSPKSRGEFLSRIALHDWDLVIVSHSAFKLLPVKPETLTAFFEVELQQLEDYLWELKAAKSEGRARKEIEKAKKRAEAKLSELSQMRKDAHDTITWEELGVGAVFVDEAHAFKNLYFTTKMTRIAGLPNASSERAFDLFIKVRWLLDHGGRVVFATGTPVSNSLAEVYTCMRYLQHDLLEELGIAHFDAWAQTFADAVASLEMTPDGSSFRMNTRFARFTNLPELAALWRQCLDVRTAEQLNLPRPRLYSGKPLTVTLPTSDDLKAYVSELAQRVEAIKSGGVEPTEDNILKVTGDGRKAALDLRLVMLGASEPPHSKLNTLATMAAAIHAASASRRGAQLIFCDLATPKPQRDGKA